MHWQVEPVRNLLQLLKRRCIDAALNQAQEIDGYTDQFGKLLLGQATLKAKAVEAFTELLP